MELPKQLHLPPKPGKGAGAAEHLMFRGAVMTFYCGYREAGARFADAQFAALCGLKLRTFQDWKRRWRKEGNAGLKPRSRRPRTSRKSMLADPKLRDIAVKWRERTRQGGEPLRRYLAAQHGIVMSRSLANRLLAQLRKEKRIKPLYAGKKRTRLRGNKKRAKPACDASAQDYRRAHPRQLLPGERIQMDTMFANFRHGKMDVIIAVDVCSRRPWLLPVHSRSSSAAADLLGVVCADCQQAGGVRVVQVDGGGEFQGALAQECQRRGIARMVNPPGSPQCNAFVESFIGTLRRELLNALPHDLSAAQLRRRLFAWLRYYNSKRYHSALGDETPIIAFNRLAHRPGKNRNMY